MHRFFLFVAFFISISCLGQNYAGIQRTELTAAGQGSTFRLIGTGAPYHQISWTISGGAVSGCSVRVDSSADALSWNAGDIISAQTCTSNGVSSITSGTFNYARVNVTTFTASSGTPTITITYTIFRATDLPGPANIRDCSNFAGVTAGARIIAAYADLPSTGGTIDCRGEEGNQVISSKITFNKPTTLLLGNATYTLSGVTGEFFLIGENSQIIGLGSVKETDSDPVTVLQVASSVGATVDVIRVAGNEGGGPIASLRLENFAITAQSGTPGRYGIHLDCSINAILDIEIDNVMIDALGSYGIFLTNGTPITDGFFTSVIENSVINNGIKLNNAGDTLRILNNRIRGANIGVDVTFVAGASTLIIQGNNISNLGGAIKLGVSATSSRILYNEIETPASFTGSNGAVIDLNGDSSDPVDHALIQGNSIQVLSANSDDHGIRVNYADNTEITNNYFSRGSGSAKDILITANANDTYIGENRWQDTTIASILGDSGTRTVFAAPLAGLLKLKQGLLFDNGKNLSWIDSGGTNRSVLTTTGTDIVTLYGYQGSTLLEGVNGAVYLYDSAGNIGFRLGVNCADGAGDAACTSAGHGSFVIDAADTNTVVSTTAVTANSEILIQEDSSLGTRLGVTCNTTIARTYAVTARTAGTSFTVTASASPITNPACLHFSIVN